MRITSITLPPMEYAPSRWRKFNLVKVRFRPLLLRKIGNEESLQNIDIAYGVQMPLDSVSKSLWPPTPIMVCGDA